MNDDRAAKELFQEVVDLSPEDRAIYLEKNCDDPELRAEVQALLDAYDTAAGFMSRPYLEAKPWRPEPSPARRRMGGRAV